MAIPHNGINRKYSMSFSAQSFHIYIYACTNFTMCSAFTNTYKLFMVQSEVQSLSKVLGHIKIFTKTL